MDLAIEQLSEGLSSSDMDNIKKALAAEQLAYQSLLKLRAIEHQVARNNQQQSGGGGRNSRSQQQLQQLQLKNDQNRYETQRLATAPESTEQRENRQILSRLRELARRQHDLNKRIKELQSALEEAETDEEKEEIEKRLQRLREQQQQILRDAEELQQRMQNEENQSRMNEESQQLEQARENIRQSSEALEQGETARAAAEGTRAERELTELRDEFQKRTSGQFTETVRQMRAEARDIEKRQEQISEELREAAKPDQQNRSLSQPDQRRELSDQLDDQRSRVEQLRESMRDTIEKAEEFEPILAEALYDTYRDTEQQSPEEALRSTQQSLNRGFVNDARREERRAGERIRQLREGIERAAESVLGDETEALRRANDELKRLTREVNDEMQDADPGSRRDASADESNPSDASPEEAGDSPDADADPAHEHNQGQRAGGSNPRDSENPRDGNDRENRRGDRSAQQGEGSSGANERPATEDDQENSGENSQDRQANDQQQGDQQQGDQQSGGRQASQGNRRDDQQDSSSARNSTRDAWGADPNPPRLFDSTSDNDIFDDESARPVDRDSVRPLTGRDFLDWSDRLRDVEEMIADDELRAEAARIRDQAKSIRKNVRRHSQPPNWDMVRMKVVNPLVELQDRVAEELLRRSSRNSMVPIDRDPVPPEFEKAVKRYYEQLGRGQ